MESSSLHDEQRTVIILLMAVLAVLVLAGLIAALGLWRQGVEQGLVAEQSLESVTNSIGMQLVHIPAGKFVMGEDAPGRGPVREVQVAPFYMGVYEVTQAQWQAVMGFNPSEYQDPRRPVEQVTWLQVQAFLEELNRLEGTNKYRLPSEAEWEYAARAGSQGRYFFGAEAGWLGRYALFGVTNGTRPVGSKYPNPWGLYDVYGNVWEWVQECWHDDYTGAPDDSRVWGGGDCSQRTLRGGGWSNRANYMESTARGSYSPTSEDVNNGFRVAMAP